MSYSVRLEICISTASIKKYKSIIKKAKKKHNNIVVLISEAVIDSYICHGKFVSVNIMIEEC